MKRLTLVACLILLLLIPSVYATESVVVSGLSQSTAARGTTLTVTVTGSGFTDGRASGSSIYIYKCGAVSPGGTNPPISGSVISWSPTSITASFSLGSAIKVGEYGVKVHTIDPVFGDNWGYKVNVLQV